MRIANWKDYELIDAACGERLERWGDVILIRPDPQIIWETKRESPLWQRAHARYIRSASGGGHWQIYKEHPNLWELHYKALSFQIRPMGFKHTGIFPEQAVNWDFVSDKIRQSKKQMNILNLFAYTGGATLACLHAGAKVCHVDASKGMVGKGKRSAVPSARPAGQMACR